jgi:hypothetical protein
MRRAAALDVNPAYEFMRGILALKTNKAEEAEEAFSAIQEDPSQSGLLARYYLGRIRSDEGKKDIACNLYSSVSTSADAGPKLKAAAVEACEKTQSLSGFKISPNKLRIYMQQGDMVTYE